MSEEMSKRVQKSSTRQLDLPIKEVLIRIRLLPLDMVPPKIAAISMFVIYHLEEILKSHDFCMLFPLRLLAFLALPQFRSLLGVLCLYIAARAGIIISRSRGDVANPFPSISRLRFGIWRGGCTLES